MGWYHTKGADRSRIIEEITQSCSNAENSRTCINSCLRFEEGRTILWTLFDVLLYGEGSHRKYICCNLLEHGKDYGWGYKPIDEICGPFYYSCPAAYLDTAEVKCPAWRDKVRAYHQKKANQLKASKEAEQRNNTFIGLVARNSL